MKDIFSMTAVELVRMIMNKSLGVEELTLAYLERIERHDGLDGLNTVVELNENVVKQARRLDTENSIRKSAAMFGLPVLLKDNINVKGLHTTAGSLALADNIAANDAPIVANLRRNGALILGKTNMTEFANFTTDSMPAGYSSRGGQVKNAYHRKKSPGGSSSGSAVAMSAGFCAAAVGTDTSFSIIGCATENGVTGLKPAHGSLSLQGILPIARTLDSAGPITRDLTDALLVYSCMRNELLPPVQPAIPRNIRLAVNTYNRDQISEAQLARYETVFTALRRDGVRTGEVNHAYSPCLCDIMRCEFRHDLEEYLVNSTAHRRTLKGIIDFYENNPNRMMKYGNSHLRCAMDGTSGRLDDGAYILAMAERERLRAQMLDSLSDFDACVMTGPTNIMHFTGLPSLAIRLGMSDDGMPRGMILYGTDELRLFAAALTLEKYCAPVSMPKL